MRLFNANRASPSEADRARDLRLTSIASRYRARPEISLVPDSEPEPQAEPQAEMILEPQPEPELPTPQDELLLEPEQPEQRDESEGEWPANE